MGRRPPQTTKEIEKLRDGREGSWKWEKKNKIVKKKL